MSVLYNEDDKPVTCISVSPTFKALGGIFGAVMLWCKKEHNPLVLRFSNKEILMCKPCMGVKNQYQAAKLKSRLSPQALQRMVSAKFSPFPISSNALVILCSLAL